MFFGIIHYRWNMDYYPTGFTFDAVSFIQTAAPCEWYKENYKLRTDFHFSSTGFWIAWRFIYNYIDKAIFDVDFPSIFKKHRNARHFDFISCLAGCRDRSFRLPLLKKTVDQILKGLAKFGAFSNICTISQKVSMKCSVLKASQNQSFYCCFMLIRCFLFIAFLSNLNAGFWTRHENLLLKLIYIDLNSFPCQNSRLSNSLNFCHYCRKNRRYHE